MQELLTSCMTEVAMQGLLTSCMTEVAMQGLLTSCMTEVAKDDLLAKRKIRHQVTFFMAARQMGKRKKWQKMTG